MGTHARSLTFEVDQLGNRIIRLPRDWKPKAKLKDPRPCHRVTQVLDRVWRKYQEKPCNRN
ncbi:hypothetical protein IRY61_02580 [Candidatus Saccharibacteria bacterium]|nr:hypothetical protein [Candidatus Saccharibacteria bacterium]